MLYIGINTGTETGFAVWNSNKRKLETVNSFNFWQCISSLEKYKGDSEDLMVIINDPSVKKVLLKNDCENNIQKLLQTAKRNAAAKRDIDLIAGYCDENSIKYKYEKLFADDWSPGFFKQLTGMKIRVSANVINAVRLVWGK